MEEKPILYWPNIVNVKNVELEGQFLACENIKAHNGIEIASINGMPIFNCRHTYTWFLDISLSELVSNMGSSSVIIRNIEFTNEGCIHPLIRVSKVNSFLASNILVKNSPETATPIDEKY